MVDLAQIECGGRKVIYYYCPEKTKMWKILRFCFPDGDGSSEAISQPLSGMLRYSVLRADGDFAHQLF